MRPGSKSSTKNVTSVLLESYIKLRSCSLATNNSYCVFFLLNFKSMIEILWYGYFNEK